MQKKNSKVRLSREEIYLLREQEFFYAKKIITEKIYHQLSDVSLEIRASSVFKSTSFPSGTDLLTGKISKGENYLGLPYIVLDFPRLFTKEKILAFRTMVWWGNFISHSLIKSVNAKDDLHKLVRRISSMDGEKLFFCINDSPWHHHFDPNNFAKLGAITKKEITDHLFKKGFLKVARKIPVSEINRLREFSVESFELFAELV